MCPFYTTSQMCDFDTGIGTEELAHLEMVAAIVHQLTKNLSMEEIENSGFKTYVNKEWQKATERFAKQATVFRNTGSRRLQFRSIGE